MINRKGFTAVQLIVAGAIISLLLIVAVAMPNAVRQTHNSSRTQDVHLLGLLIKDQQLGHSGMLPTSCNNTQADCFVRDAKLAYYDNTSTQDTIITYFRNQQAFNHYSPQLDVNDPEVVHKVYIHSYASCNEGLPSGLGAGMNSLIIQYAIETFYGPQLICKDV